MQTKDKFEEIKGNAKEFAKRLARDGSLSKSQDYLPSYLLKIFFPNLPNDEIYNATYKLKKDDDSIDAFFLSEEDQTINFCQFKTVESHKKIENTILQKTDIDYFMGIEKRLTNELHIEEHSNSRVKEIARIYNEYREKDYQVIHHFFIFGEISKRQSIIDANKNLQVYDFKKILDRFNDEKSKSQEEEIDKIILKPSVDHTPIRSQFGSSRNTCIMVINGEQLVKIREDFRYRLFSKNVRYYLSASAKKGGINDGIINTAIGEPSSFFFFNNGITFIASSIKSEKENTIQIEKPSIINGAQTVESLYQAYMKKISSVGEEEADKHFKQIHVLCRVLVAGSTKEKAEEFQKKVVRFNNTQNKIEIHDFWSLAKNQKVIQKFFAKKKFFYETKRGEIDYLKERNKGNSIEIDGEKFFKENFYDMFKMSEMALVYRAWQGHPEAEGKNKIFEETIYKTIFPEDRKINDEYINSLLLAYWVDGAIQSQLSLLTKITKSVETGKLEREEEISKLIQTSSFFNKTEKQAKADNLKKYILNKSMLKYSRYHLLAFCKEIFDRLEKNEYIVDSKLFLVHDREKELNENNIPISLKNLIDKWLYDLGNTFFLPVYEKFYEEKKISTQTMLKKPEFFSQMKSTLDDPKTYGRDKDITDFFPPEYIFRQNKMF